jgi:cupin fold WbuC family metalloprotein
VIASPPATKALDPDPFPRRSLRHVVYAALLHFGLETAKEEISDLLADAAASPRKRMNLNLHPELNDPINRFVNAGLVGTYVRPHRHRIGRWELVSVLQGSLDLLIFKSCGELKGRFPLSAQGASLGDASKQVLHVMGLGERGEMV